MKTLYESILDDEDVLMDSARKDANNPFIQLKYILIENLEDAKDRSEEVKKLIKKPIIDVVKKYPDLKGREIGMKFYYYKYSKALSYVLYFKDDNGDSQEAITITVNSRIKHISIGLAFPSARSVAKYNTDTLVDNINKTLKKKYGFRDSDYNKHVKLDF